ncbi:MAG: hypothetical protein FJZ00_04275 [Candidatus Sericytochromatia bacterium]|uniref:Clostripain n=1 Tax=Candidatus Tanganyikabacteria bacterium TaxID=2961651 RepID=A0A937X3Y2_9BACT|nr:hypothetical protein [Candidatus Tanganyikabacteria bacterium]
MSLALTGCGSIAGGLQANGAGSLAARAAAKPWGYMHLVAHDNALGVTTAFQDVYEQARGLPNVAPVAFMDDPGADGGFRVSIGAPGQLAKDKVPEFDSASPKAVSDLLMFSSQHHPAQRRILAISGHGGGVLRGLLADENGSQSKVLPASQLTSALRTQPVDILFMDACFMQTVEVVFDLQGAAEVVIGSESESYVNPAAHLTMLKQLQEISATVPADAAATRMVQAAGGSVMPDGTLSAVRARRLNTMISGLAKLSNDLAFAVRSNPTLKANIRRAVANSQGFMGATDPRLAAYNSYRDLGDLLANIGSAAGGDIQKQVWTLLDDYNRNVIAFRAQGGKYGRSTGLAIYAPAGGEVSLAYSQTAFASYTRWADFLSALNANTPWHNPVVADRFPGAFHSRSKLNATVVGQAAVYEVPNLPLPSGGYPGAPGYGTTPGYPSNPDYPGTAPGYPAPGYPQPPRY